MSAHKTIDHEGIVRGITGQTAEVLINSQSACASCHARGACSAADRKEKILEVPVGNLEVSVGEKVNVLISRRTGLRAVAFGYVYPFLLLMAILVILTVAGVNELRAGSMALISLVPYYIMLYLLRQHIGKVFTFNLRKQNYPI